MKNFNIIVIDKDERDYIRRCKNIAEENNLSISDIGKIEFSKYVICAMQDEKVVGYISLMNNVMFTNDAYINQLEVSSCVNFEDVATKLIRYTKHHSKDFSYIVYGEKAPSIKLIKLLQKEGFNKLDEVYGQTILSFHPNHIKDNSHLAFTLLDIESEL